MLTGYASLTDKEKDALRLLLRGHDAKSSARALGLSVHTVNERLRDARRKLGVTSSREAARIVLAEEGPGPLDSAPETLGDKPMGDAQPERSAANDGTAATGRWAKRRFALTFAGVLAMSLLLAALLAPASPLAILPAALSGGAETAAEAPEQGAARAAERFLDLLDEGRWADSYAMTGAQFRALNTQARWAEVSQKVRAPLGKALNRDLIANEYVPAPPEGYRMIKFRARYDSGADQIETLSLVYEDGAWKVVGIVIEAADDKPRG